MILLTSLFCSVFLCDMRFFPKCDMRAIPKKKEKRKKEK